MSRHFLEQNKLDEKSKASMASRTLVAFVLIGILIPTITVGGWLFFGVISFFLLIAIYELATAPHKKFRKWVIFFAYLIILCLVYWFLIYGNIADYVLYPDNFIFSLEYYFSGIHAPILIIALMLFGYFLGCVADESFTIADLGYMVSMSLVLGLGFQAIFFMRYYPYYSFSVCSFYADEVIVFDTVGHDLGNNPFFEYGLSSALFYWIAFMVVMNDTFAYFVGSLYGKHKMNPRVSPKKSWEGLFGGLIGACICGLIIAFSMAATGYPILPFLDMEHWYWIVCICIVTPLFGVLGDLAFSLIKRQYAIKDFGTLLKSHGGILDRADSVTFSFIGAALFIMLIITPFEALMA